MQRPRWLGGPPRDTPFMRNNNWGTIAHEDYPQRHRPQPDLVNWRQPATVGQNYDGLQLRNGVAQLSSCYQVPPLNSDVPYWQTASRINPPQQQRVGAGARSPMGPVQAVQIKASTNIGKPLTSTGVGTMYGPSAAMIGGVFAE